MKKIVLFDLDGTLIDSSEGIINSLRYMQEKLNLENLAVETLQKFIGPPLKESVKLYYGLDDEAAQLAETTYREHFSEIGLKQLEIYPQVPETLTLLAEDYSLAVATSKPEPYAKQIMQEIGLNQFSGIYGADLAGKLHDKAAVIAYALEELGSREAVMVGDRKFDLIGAEKNQIPAIGVLYGFGDEVELTTAGATAIVEKAEELPVAIKKIL